MESCSSSDSGTVVADGTSPSAAEARINIIPPPISADSSPSPARPAMSVLRNVLIIVSYPPYPLVYFFREAECFFLITMTAAANAHNTTAAPPTDTPMIQPLSF